MITVVHSINIKADFVELHDNCTSKINFKITEEMD